MRFEQLKKAFASAGVESQRLLMPEMIELTFSEADTVRRNTAQLEKLGFEIEGFGGNSFRLNSVPDSVASSGHIRLLRDIVAELAETGTASPFDLLLEKLLSTIACHSVTRGTRQLEQRQIRQLLSDMDSTGFSAHCPHGRPVSRAISLTELEKMFKRT